MILTKRYNKIVIFILLFLTFCLAVFVRTFFSYEAVFSEPIKYSFDDGVYHIRLVENLLLGNNFPNWIYFDAFTNFPNGTYIHFAPFFGWLLALIIWIISFGKPTLEIINKIAPFYPVFLGSSLVFVVYFIAKAFWKSKQAALLSALLVSVSAPLLLRSYLGFTDHHSAEVLFSSLAVLFFVLALNENGKISKRFWLLSSLAGLCLGFYFLVWTGAILFLFIFFSFIVIYYFSEYFLGNRQNWILWLGLIMFLISFLMILPFLGKPDLFNTYMYNIRHLFAFLFSFFAFGIIFFTDYIFIKKSINPKLFPAFFLFIGGIIVLFVKGFFNSGFQKFISWFSEINIGMTENIFARQLISEMTPITFNGMVKQFHAIFFTALIALAIILFFYIKQKKPQYLFIVYWTLFIMFLSGLIPFWGQNRFTYYLSVNFSLLAGFLFYKGFIFGWNGIRKSKEIEGSNGKYVLVGSVIVIFNILYLILYPLPFNLDYKFPASLPYIAQDAGGAKGNLLSSDVYDLMFWLKNNTPETGVDYYALYEEPEINKETGKINSYSYPESSYGVLANWEIGHMITYYGHRIPVANPFQQGIGKKLDNGEVIPGQASFFIEKNEQKAAQYLDLLKVRYIISDSDSSNIDGIFLNNLLWVQGNYDGYLKKDGSLDFDEYYKSMIVRLHIFDGKEVSFKQNINEQNYNFFVEALSRYRLLYESDKILSELKIDSESDIRQYKIFEYVKGAKIKGRALAGADVEISAKIKTNSGREFVYKNTVKANNNGMYEIIVPYSTGKQTNSEVEAQSYVIKIGGKMMEVKVLEQDILTGKEIIIY